MEVAVVDDNDEKNLAANYQRLPSPQLGSSRYYPAIRAIFGCKESLGIIYVNLKHGCGTSRSYTCGLELLLALF